jgi:hypothetical protein
MLDRVDALRAQWIREKRDGTLPPVKPDVAQLRARCAKLSGG